MRKVAGAIGLTIGMYLAAGALASILLPATYPHSSRWLATLCSRAFEAVFVTLFGKW